MIGPNLSDWALKHRSFIVFTMIAIVIAGLSSYFRLGRSEDPAFTFRTMIVQAAWPGATLDDTLSQLTERLERKLQETRGLDFLRSHTSPGLTTIFVTLKGSTSAREVPDIWYQVRKNIGDITHTLPQGVVGPGFNDDFGDTYGLIYAFTADGFSHRELRDYVEDMRSKLLLVKDVSKIEILGAQDEQVYVEFSTSQLAGLGVDRAALVDALRAQNTVIPAGSLQTGDEKLSIRVTGTFRSENDLLDVNFPSNGRLIRLRDIAQIRRSLSDPPQPMFRVNGKPAIGLAIAMRDGGDILALGDNIKKAIESGMSDLPLGIDVTLVSDQPVIVKNAIGKFMTSLWQAIAIIMACSIVSLGIRPGAVVALSIPLTVAIIFPIMELIGIDLQRISLGALIIALGLLVDDAMTTVDVMISRMAAGDSKERAATFAYDTLAFPMLTGSFITAAGFVPIGFARSSAGEYTFSIFAVVTIALIVSWFVAVLFAPLLGVWLLKSPEPRKDEKPSRIMSAFHGLLLTAMRRRWTTIAIALACFAASVLALPLVPRQFFPASDRPELVVDLTLPQNASIFASDRVAAKLDAILKGNPDVTSWSTYVGRGAIRFYLPLNVQLNNDFFAQAVVIAKDVAARKRLQAALEQKLADEFPSVVSRVSPLELGPPVGWPVQYRVSGPALTEVRTIALQLGQLLGSDNNLRGVNFDWMEPARKVRIEIDQDQARLLGLNSQGLSAYLNTVMTGAPITQLRDDIYLIDIITRAQDEQRVSLATMQSLQVPLPGGRTVPLSQIARFEFGQEYPLVWRRDRVPTLTVQADVIPGSSPEAAVTSLAPGVEKLRASLPAGYRIAVGGTVEESANSQASVYAMVPAMLFLMLLFLMAQLHSFSRLAMVLSLVPMGLIGIVAALLVSGRPLGFVAILGILALMGMIARNAVILIEQIEAERAQGREMWDAVVEGAASRFRPIMLTAISTVLGFVPIAPTVFWGPMAFAIMGGLFVATVLTLLVLPALYVIFFRVNEPEKRLVV
ncbi:efflux RND transporter permease subunit [Bradyrhizobium sp. CCGUVB23]|uniref:efflux RND transporter permease subunit n=1 Tax=Bradyrhizobium sp. CCGUVB23 TaxID=2949630 RepID=UPI0020B25510|nr:efflux RND transporter permease subunit [Bradyrhizobium sp. CCGUVB23]MCP3468106.1 efflux RND transporter permease subunit [Bradyrhizobium sp. CCGUVB23]